MCARCQQVTDGDTGRPSACCGSLHVLAASSLEARESFAALIAPPGCECGAAMHEGHHAVALACEDVEAHTDCDCGGCFDDETGEVVHDGFCPCFPDEPGDLVRYLPVTP